MGRTMLIVSGVLLIVFLGCIYYTTLLNKNVENIYNNNHVYIDNIYDGSTDNETIDEGEGEGEGDNEYSYIPIINIDRDRKPETVLENNGINDLGVLEEIIICD